jgi:hypothetical protein
MMKISTSATAMVENKAQSVRSDALARDAVGIKTVADVVTVTFQAL